MKTDRELLELAAKAAGIKGKWSARGKCIVISNGDGLSMHHWRPLEDDGDALRLAVNLWFQVTQSYCKDDLGYYAEVFGYCEYHNGDPASATRRAITRAAAAIGEGME